MQKLKPSEFWGDGIARMIVEELPKESVYTCAAGISPSGVVHFGNFRDVITSYAVNQGLERLGKKTRLIFSWDNFDRFRKVPVGVPESFVEHIGKPLSKVPDPLGELSSYAERFQAPFVEAMKRLGIEIEYKDQTKSYESGIYDDLIEIAISKRDRVAEVLLSFMTEKAMREKNINAKVYRENFYPISVYSRFTGKDFTKILGCDGMRVAYKCLETGKTETVDLREEHIAKLNWKVDWPMRWSYEQVHFEPGGADHAAPGGSYDVASVLAKELFNFEPPVFVEYLFVGIRGLGAKMSGSRGNAVSPLDLLDIYEPDLLKWMYKKRRPNQSFELAFDTEIYRQYDEYDGEHSRAKAIPFRRLVGLGQIVQWNESKLLKVIEALGLDYDKNIIARRLLLARNWLIKYNPDQLIELRNDVNSEYASGLSEERKAQIKQLHNELADKKDASVEELEFLSYKIPKKPELSEKELKKAQREFFKDVYNLLIGKDTGPRLSTFLWALDRNKVLVLLKVI